MNTRYVITTSLSFICAIFMTFVTEKPVNALMVDDSCKPVEVIFARGSGQVLGDTTKEAWRFFKQIETRINTANVHRYELGTDSYDGAKYVPVDVKHASNGNAIGAYFSAGGAFDYGKSVKAGMKEFQKYITDRHNKCPNSRIILGGYSQGAQVVRQVSYQLSAEIKNVVDFMAFFGDPKLYLPEGEGVIPPACQGKNYSAYRRDVPNCRTSSGALRGQKPYLTDNFDKKTGLWCYAKDGMCGGTSNIFDVTDHEKYKDEGKGIDEAAQEIATRLKTTLPGSSVQTIDTKPHAKTGSAGLDTVFVIDTTGSMGGKIEQAKTYARQSAAKIAAANGRVALVAHKDAGDVYTAQVMSNLQSDQTDFLNQLNTLTASGGGDTPEGTLHALMTAFDGLSWQNGATKAAVVLTDAGFHNPDITDGATIDSVTKRSLEIDPVNVYPVVPTELTSDYQSLADRTSGQVIADTGDTVTALTTALTKIINRPVAQLANDAYYADKNQAVHFDASRSYAVDAAITGYDWDFDGDGTFDQHTTDPTVDHTYATDFDSHMQVRVSADNGTIASASAPIKVGAPAKAAMPVSPAAPASLAVSAASTTATSATLSWKPSDSKAVKWRIAVGDVAFGDVDASQTSIRVDDLVRSDDVIFSVAGVAADGTAGEYATATLAKTPVPSSPSPACIKILGLTFCLGLSLNLNLPFGLSI